MSAASLALVKLEPGGFVRREISLHVEEAGLGRPRRVASLTVHKKLAKIPLTIFHPGT